MDAQTSTVECVPIEIWNEVFGMFPLTTVQQCLSVSRLFHDLAAPILFSTLYIRLDVQYDYRALTSPAEQTKNMPRWASILLHITSNYGCDICVVCEAFARWHVFESQ